MPGVTTRKTDLGSVEDFTALVETVSPDIVVHAAGLTSVEDCEEDPERAWHVNVRLSANVAEACRRSAVALVHVSTDHLFSGLRPFASEDWPVTPVNVYGRTKADAEARVLDVNPDALIIRTNFFAWGTSYRQSFSDFIIKALRKGDGVALFQDVYFSPILADRLVMVVHELLSKRVSGVFNVVGDERISKLEFGLRIAHHFGLDPSLIGAGSLADRPHLVQRPLDMSLSNEKVCHLLGKR